MVSDQPVLNRTQQVHRVVLCLVRGAQHMQETDPHAMTAHASSPAMLCQALNVLPALAAHAIEDLLL